MQPVPVTWSNPITSPPLLRISAETNPREKFEPAPVITLVGSFFS